MYIDSHCHLNLIDLSMHGNKLQNVIDAATAADVNTLLCVATRLETVPEIIAIATQYPNVYASVGLHPNENVAQEPTAMELAELAKLAKVVAIGETGLDYYRSEGDLTWQQQRFRQHIQAAKQVSKPLIVHTRQARTDTITILREEKAQDIGGVLHCFTEDWNMAKKALDLNFYISFSGIVTFKNATELQDVAKKVPLEKMLIETDAPYLAPVPFRGKPNQPAYVRYVAECIAQLRNISIEAVGRQTSQNFCDLFNVSAAASSSRGLSAGSRESGIE